MKEVCGRARVVCLIHVALEKNRQPCEVPALIAETDEEREQTGRDREGQEARPLRRRNRR